MRQNTIARMRLIHKIRKTPIPKLRLRFYYARGELNIKFGSMTIPYEQGEVHRKEGYWAGFSGWMDRESHWRNFWKYIQRCAFHNAIYPDFISTTRKG